MNKLFFSFNVNIMNNIEFPRQVLIVGRTGSGKSTWLRKFLNHHKSKIDHVYIFNTRKDEYADITPHVYDYEQLNVVDKFLVDNPEIRKKHRVIIYDNFAHTKLENNVIQMYTSGRHNNITVICLCQYIFKVSPVIRANTSHFICFKSCSRDYEEMYLLQDDEEFPDKANFISYMKRNTGKDYNPVVIEGFVRIGDDSKSVYKDNCFEEQKQTKKTNRRKPPQIKADDTMIQTNTQDEHNLDLSIQD